MKPRDAVQLAVLLAVAVSAPYWIGTTANQDLLTTTAVVAIAALSLDIIIGHMGQFSFGHAAFWGIGAYATTKFTINLGVPVYLSLIASTLVSGVAGLLVGAVVMRRNRAIELAMVTLGLGVLLASVANNYESFFGGEAGILGLPQLNLFGLQFVSPTEQYFFCLAILLLLMYALHRVTRSRFGRAVHSLRENEYLAASVGVPVRRYYTMAFAAAGAFGGLAGALYAHTQGYASPGLFELSYMFEFLIIVVVGGSGTIGGAIVGAAIYVWGNQFAESISVSGRLLMFGVLLLIVTLFLPRGVYPTVVRGVEALLQRLRRGGGGRHDGRSMPELQTAPHTALSEDAHALVPPRQGDR